MDKINKKDFEELSTTEMQDVNGGETGDAAYWIGRTYVWTTAHILTGGLSTMYLVAKNL